MPVSEDQGIAEILSSVKTIALLGASHKPERPSYRVMKFLCSAGYRVFPVNPGLKGSVLHGQQVYASLADIPGEIDMIDVFRNAAFLPAVVDETIAQGVKILWTQLGVVDEAAAERAEAKGIRVVMDRCPAIELPRLQELGLL